MWQPVPARSRFLRSAGAPSGAGCRHARDEQPFLPHARTVTDGAALTFETVGEGPAPLRVNPDEATLLRVIGGIARLTVADGERVLVPGDEAIVPRRPGAPARRGRRRARAS